MRWILHALVLGVLTLLARASAIGNLEDHAMGGRSSTLLQKKALSCSNKDVKIVVKILSVIRASPFCSSFLSIKTSTATVFSTATSVTTTTVKSTSTVVVPVTATSTVGVTATGSVFVTNAVTITPPTVVVTSTVVASTSTVVTVTSTSISTICTGVGVMKREAQPTSPALQRRVNIPSELKSFAVALISTACGCYVTTPTVTTTVKTTATSTASVTTVVPSTSDSTATTVFVLTTKHVTTTVEVDTSVTLNPMTSTTTSTSTSTITSTSTAVVPTTTVISGVYTQQFSGSGCVYNQYSNYFVLAAANFQDAEQQCACKCNQDSSCQSFFIFYAPPSGRSPEHYDCTTDLVPYSSSFTQCGVSFAAQGKGYNKVV